MIGARAQLSKSAYPREGDKEGERCIYNDSIHISSALCPQLEKNINRHSLELNLEKKTEEISLSTKIVITVNRQKVIQ